MDSIDNFITPPNGDAYEKAELRNGSPLSYVAEKLSMALVFTHSVTRTLQSEGGKSASKGNEPYDSALVAFRYSTTAFLALYNMLGLIEDQNKFKALIQLTPDQFEMWLAMVAREGSIKG